MRQEQEVTFTITLPVKHAYTFIDEMRRQSMLVFNTIKDIDDLERKRKVAECAERLANLADRLANELSKELEAKPMN